MKEFKLDNHPKIKPGFTVPEDYFDHFPAQVMSQIEMPEPKVISLQNHKNSWVYVAAAVLVLSLSLPIINQVAKKQQPNQLEIENYLAYQDDISEDYLVSLLETEDISNIKIDYNLEDKSIEDALPADIENYITD